MKDGCMLSIQSSRHITQCFPVTTAEDTAAAGVAGDTAAAEVDELRFSLAAHERRCVEVLHAGDWEGDVCLFYG